MVKNNPHLVQLQFYLFIMTTAHHFVLYRSAEEIENFDQQRNLMSGMPQNEINASLCCYATKYKIICNSVYKLLR